MLVMLFIKRKHFLFRYFYLFSPTKQRTAAMRCIYVESSIYAEYQKTIFFVTNCNTDGTLEYIQQHCNEFTNYLARNAATGYTLHITDATDRYTARGFAVRNNPLLEIQDISDAHPSQHTQTLAAIVDVDYTPQGTPIAEILITEIPQCPTPEELHSSIYGLLNAIIRIEKEYNRYTTSSSNLHYSLPLAQGDKQEFIATDLLFCQDFKQHPKSPLLIDSNFDIHLPQYPQITIELAPLPKALYILLLLHPEGFILKEITQYASELRNIYRTISGRQNMSVLNKMLESITDPTSNPLHKNLSIIRRAFLCKLRSDIAECYIPTQGRNTLHRIPLESKMIELPTALLHC